MVRTMITALWWHVVNSTRPFKCSKSIMVQQFVLSWQRCLNLFNWRPRECRRYKFIGSSGVGSFKDITLGWKRKSKNSQINRMARLGSVTVEDGILESHRKMMAFHTIRNKFHIPRIWVYLAINIGIAYISFPDSRVGGRGPMEGLVIWYWEIDFCGAH